MECRTVCRLWREEATRLLVKQMDKIEISFIYRKQMKFNSLNSFLEMAKNCSFKFTNFSLTNIPMDDEQTKKLLSEYGSSIKLLRLHYDDGSNRLTTEDLLDILTKKAPLLKELDLELPNSILENRLYPTTEDFPELKIEKLTLYWPILAEQGEYSGTFLKDLFRSCKFLKSFIFEDVFGSNILRAFSECGSMQNFRALEVIYPTVNRL